MTERIYRKLTIADLRLTPAMNHNFREGFTSEKEASQFLGDPRNWLFTCLENDSVIGFIYGYELKHISQSGNMLYVHEVGVMGKYQRQGIGYKLLSELKAACREKRISKLLCLFTQKHNVPACRLYEKAGGEKAFDSQDDDRCYFFKVKT
ncbi:MAG: GNAT family N-acetyltransferase [Dehalococcoidales bacterium]|nr:GNAT family N-acetyltransferase [Dehalococcoidales bacterium]